MKNTSKSIYYNILNSFNRVTELLDYSADELVGRNLYNLCHAEDADKLKKSHLDRKYRFLFEIIWSNLFKMKNVPLISLQ